MSPTCATVHQYPGIVPPAHLPYLPSQKTLKSPGTIASDIQIVTGVPELNTKAPFTLSMLGMGVPPENTQLFSNNPP